MLAMRTELPRLPAAALDQHDEQDRHERDGHCGPDKVPGPRKPLLYGRNRRPDQDRRADIQHHQDPLRLVLVYDLESGQQVEQVVQRSGFEREDHNAEGHQGEVWGGVSPPGEDDPGDRQGDGRPPEVVRQALGREDRFQHLGHGPGRRVDRAGRDRLVGAAGQV